MKLAGWLKLIVINCHDDFQTFLQEETKTDCVCKTYPSVYLTRFILLQFGTYQQCVILFMCLKTTNKILNLSISTASKRSLGQGNVFTRVCHSIHRGGLPLDRDSLDRDPLDRDPLYRDPPSPSTYIWWRPPKRVSILLECILVWFFFFYEIFLA